MIKGNEKAQNTPKVKNNTTAPFYPENKLIS